MPNTHIAISSGTGAFHVGDEWEPEATVTHGGEEVEPGGFTFTFESYKGVKTVGTATKVAKGKWKSSITLTEAGVWKVSVETQGVGTTTQYQASQPAQIGVKPAFDE